MSPLADIAEELYVLPLGDFVAERDRRAKEVRADGDRALAAAVKALRKPSVAAWAANMLARQRPDLIDAVAGTGAALRQAQSALDRARLRELDGERRRVLREAVQAGRELGDEIGQAVGDAAAEDLEAIVRAAMTDPRAEAALRSGLLVRAMEVAGLGSVDLEGVLAVPGIVPGEDADEAQEEASPAREAADGAAAAGRRPRGTGPKRATGGPLSSGRRSPASKQAQGGQAAADEDSATAPSADKDVGAGSRAGGTSGGTGRAAGGARRRAEEEPAETLAPNRAAEKRRERAVARAEAAQDRARARAEEAAEKLAAADDRARTVQATILQLQSEIEELRRGIDEREHALDRAEDALAAAEKVRERLARRAADAAEAHEAKESDLERARAEPDA